MVESGVAGMLRKGWRLPQPLVDHRERLEDGLHLVGIPGPPQAEGARSGGWWRECPEADEVALVGQLPPAWASLSRTCCAMSGSTSIVVRNSGAFVAEM